MSSEPDHTEAAQPCADQRIAVGYTRLSEQSPTSIDRQKEQIREHARDHDLDLIEIYDDGERTSGFDADRAKYQEMLTDAQAGAFDVLIVRDGSRLGRETKERIRRFYDLDDWDVEFHTVKHGHVDADEPMEVVMEVFRAASDEEAKRREIEASKAETRRRVESGYWQGRSPFGLQMGEEKHYLVPGAEFCRALRVLDEYDGGASVREAKDAADVPRGTAARIIRRADAYRTLAAARDDDRDVRIGHGWEVIEHA